MFEVIFYERADGEKPALKSILEIKDMKLKAKVFRSLKLLENGIFELRSKHGSNIVRCLYFYRHGKAIIVTNSFVKKSKKNTKK